MIQAGFHGATALWILPFSLTQPWQGMNQMGDFIRSVSMDDVLFYLIYVRVDNRKGICCHRCACAPARSHLAKLCTGDPILRFHRERPSRHSDNKIQWPPEVFAKILAGGWRRASHPWLLYATAYCFFWTEKKAYQKFGIKLGPLKFGGIFPCLEARGNEFIFFFEGKAIVPERLPEFIDETDEMIKALTGEKIVGWSWFFAFVGFWSRTWHSGSKKSMSSSQALF